MKSNYNYCLSEVLKSEGGYTNDRADPGGPTNYGITIGDYRMYVKRNATAADIKAMSLDTAKQIYKSKYWDKVNGDNLPSGVDYTVFDYGVNSGVARALKVYNRYKDQDPTTCINLINNERMSFLRGLRTFPVFGKGWTARVARVRASSLKLAKSPTVPVATGTGIAVAGSSFATYFQHNWPWIVGVSVLAAIIIGVAVHYIRKKGN